jgi:alpha-galactosidase
MSKPLYLLIILLIFNPAVSAQPFASWTPGELKLSNGVVERTIKLPSGSGTFTTTAYKPVNSEFRYFMDSNTDFQFEADNTIYSGRSKWILKNIERHKDTHNGDGVAVTLSSDDKKIELTVQFLLYPSSPAIRKNLRVKNLTGKTIQLESVDVEKFEVREYGPTSHWQRRFRRNETNSSFLE